MKRWPWYVAAGFAVILVALFAVYATLFTGWFRDDLPAFEPADNVTLEFSLLADGFNQPTYFTHHNGSILVMEQRGIVWQLHDNGTRSEWLDIQDRVRTGAERGLLGLAVDANGTAYVHYSDNDGDTVLSRIKADTNGTLDPATEAILLTQNQPYPNHNGGSVAFGPDGYLYLGLGDGGLAADPQGNGQNTNTILGAILRLDVSGTGPAEGAPGNPFINGGGDPRILHYGLRNPWRFSFDADGGLWIGDVGQDHAEEINHAPPGASGFNFGWVAYEGSQKYRDGDAPGHVPPVSEYDHDGGHCSVTGGYVWDHHDAGALRGTYIFGDYCSGAIWSHDPLTSETTRAGTFDGRISSFGVDEVGRVYVVGHGGAISHLRVS